MPRSCSWWTATPMAERSADALVASVQAGGLLDGSGPVLLLCSAGRDSHCLLDVVTRILGAPAVRVLHVDHGLREGAAGDAAQLATRCEALGVRMTVARAAPRPDGGNLQAWAREERRVAEELADGAVIVELPYAGNDWLVREVLAEAGDAAIISPESARDAVHAAASELAAALR